VLFGVRPWGLLTYVHPRYIGCLGTSFAAQHMRLFAPFDHKYIPHRPAKE
jgi:hypothetical protein